MRLLSRSLFLIALPAGLLFSAPPKPCVDPVTHVVDEKCLDAKVAAASTALEIRINQRLDLPAGETVGARLKSKADQTALETKVGYADLKKQLNDAANGVNFKSNRFWVLLAALLVFFMQAGFMCLEVGMIGRAHGAEQAVMKLLSWIMPCLLYATLGFGLMFGTSDWFLGRFWGGNLYGASTSDIQNANKTFGMEFVLFQLGFAGTAVSIVAGAIAERTRASTYILIASVMAVLVYPVFGHWAWGGSIFSEPTAAHQGWLQARNFLDFAGSTVVHSVGGWFALVAALILGNRHERFAGVWQRPNRRDVLVLFGGARTPRFLTGIKRFPVSSVGFAVLGVFMLWFGWWGFNGGSHLAYDTSIADTIWNTNLAGASGGLTAFVWALWRDPDNRYEKLIGGALGGLVAITASCSFVIPLSAFIIGACAGIVHNFAFDLLLLLHIDDPVGAVPVHAFCGVLGTLCVVPFRDKDKLAALHLKYLPWLYQLEVQALGVCVAFVFTIVVAGVCVALINLRVPIRSRPTTLTTEPLLAPAQ